MTTLICLGGGIEGLPILQAAKALGLRLVVVDGNPNAPGLALADVRVVASCYSADDTLKALYPVIQAYRFGTGLDGVLCCAIDAPNVAAAVADIPGLPGLTPEQAALSTDKLAQKTALKAAGLPAPHFAEFAEGQYLNFAAPTPDIVLKPVDSRGARGVQLLRFGQPGNFADAIHTAVDASPTGRVMVEQYLSGPQLSTESLVQDGRVLFTAVGLRNYDRLAQFAPAMIEDGFDSPYGDYVPTTSETYAGSALLANVDQLLQRACRALGWYQQGGGVVKGDWIVHDGQLVILELAARLSGGFFCLAHEWAYGVPFIDCAIRLALGERIEMKQATGGMFCSQRYVFPEPGDIGRRVESVPSLHEIKEMTPIPPTLAHARKIEHDLVGNSLWAINTGTVVSPMFTAKFATYVVHPGDVLRPVVDHGARLGQVIAVGSTPTLARQRAEAAVAAMKRALVLE